MELAFCVKTPYQLMNCVNFVWHDFEGSRGAGDLYISGIYEKYGRAVSTLSEAKLFKNIYICQDDFSGGSAHNIRRSIELLFPANAVKQYSNGSGICKRDHYNIIVFSTPSPLPIALADLNKKAKLWLYEDGSGSYYGNYFEHYGTWKTHLFYKAFGKGIESLRPERLYVNNLAMCKNTLNLERIQLPPIGNEPALLDVLDTFFSDDSQNGLCNKKYIFLSQPFNETGKNELTMVWDYLKLHYKDQTIVRPHPSEHGQEYGGLDVSTCNKMWELFCIGSLSEEQVLIGVFSTAQLVPKFLCDKEPRLIFLYHLIPTVGLSAERIASIDTFIQDFQESYKDKSRISIPMTMQEFVDAMDTL